MSIEQELKELMNKYSMNIKGISDYFDIPYKTVQKWCSGERKCPEYVINMMRIILDNNYKQNN